MRVAKQSKCQFLAVIKSNVKQKVECFLIVGIDDLNVAKVIHLNRATGEFQYIDTVHVTIAHLVAYSFRMLYVSHKQYTIFVQIGKNLYNL